MNRRTFCGAAFLAALALTGCEVGVQPGEQQVDNYVDPGMNPIPTSTMQISRVQRGNLRFVEGFEPGYATASGEGKPMLVFFTGEWCHFCHEMAKEVFTVPQVVSMSEQFTCILVDADKEPQICRQFGIGNYPTILFISPQGVPMHRVVGKQPSHQLMMAMQAALQRVARGEVSAPDTLLR